MKDAVGAKKPKVTAVNTKNSPLKPKVAAVNMKDSPLKLTKNGQQYTSGPGCIATKLTGQPCKNQRKTKEVPYCSHCMVTGDPSLKVCSHPKFGKILITKRDIPKGYTIAWWGNLVAVRKLPEDKEEWALKTHKGMIDATSYKGSLLQFCACPGPSEIPTIDFAPNSDALLAKRETTCAIFNTLTDIPRGHQVTMMYNLDEKTTEEFFEERGLKRGDVGTKRYPALKKKPATSTP